MRRHRLFALFLVIIFATSLLAGCRGQQSNAFVMVMESSPKTLDPLRGIDANSERLRQLMFNSLVRKNERFEYVGELASNIQPAGDGLSVTFTLHDNV